MPQKRVLFIPDTHSPYHDESVWELAMRIAEEFEPHIVVHLGDLLDFYNISKYLKLGRSTTVPEELELANSLLDEIEMRTDAEKYIFIKGNHEARMDKYVASRCPELLGMPGMTVESQLNLRPRGWRVVPYMDGIKIGDTYVTHGLERFGKNSAQQIVEDIGEQVVFGDVHRILYTAVGNVLGRQRIGFCPGWLGDPRKVDYRHQFKVLREWAHGVGLGYLDAGKLRLMPCPIIDGKAILEGTLVS